MKTTWRWYDHATRRAGMRENVAAIDDPLAGDRGYTRRRSRASPIHIVSNRVFLILSGAVLEADNLYARILGFSLLYRLAEQLTGVMNRRTAVFPKSKILTTLAMHI
jgi:hypothetical protein